MFERYTERARRVLFFARYEANQLGSESIETEHLLLGLIREGKGLTSRLFARSRVAFESVRQEIEGRAASHDDSPFPHEIPFSAETKRVLGLAADEADRLRHAYIGTEHLLLGILREERSVAATILMEKGMRLTTVREDVVSLLNEKTTLTRVKETPLLEALTTLDERCGVTIRPAPDVRERTVTAKLKDVTVRRALRSPRLASVIIRSTWGRISLAFASVVITFS